MKLRDAVGRRRVVACAILLACLALLYLSWGPITQRRLANTHGSSAIYSDCLFRGNPSFNAFSTYADDGGIARVYIELKDGRRFFLPDFPEEEAARLTPLIRITPSDMGVIYSDLANSMIYRDGKLVSAKLTSAFKPCKISRHPEGPFLEFPIDRDALLKEFGAPVKWSPPPKFRTGPA